MLKKLYKATARNIWLAHASLLLWMHSERDGGASENKSLSDVSNYGVCGLYEKQIAEDTLSRPRPVPNEHLDLVLVSLLLPLR